MPKQKNRPTDLGGADNFRAPYKQPKLTIFGHVGALSQAGTGTNSEVIMMNMDDMRRMRQRI